MPALAPIKTTPGERLALKHRDLDSERAKPFGPCAGYLVAQFLVAQMREGGRDHESALGQTRIDERHSLGLARVRMKLGCAAAGPTRTAKGV